MKTAEWIAALRSGKYGQTKEKLADGAGNYCCLGVLCEVAGIPNIQDHMYDSTVVQYTFEIPGGCQHEYQDVTYAESCLPHFTHNTMLEDLDLTRVVDGLEGGPEDTEGDQTLVERLMSLNDGGWTFDQIAEYIEKVAAQ